MKIIKIPILSIVFLFNTISMAQIRKTPGVYIQKIPSVIESVKEVASAIPAFIGYTEKAIASIEGDLHMVPKKISSLLEYERHFGLTENSNNYILHSSLQLYFANGGTSCYIVSIGSNKKLNKNDFISGLTAISNKDEPTLLVFPDAVNLPSNELYEIQKAALKQAAKLGDRFCILDLKQATTSTELNNSVNEFRNNIGTDNLKYGAAYSPYLITLNAKLLPPSAAVAGQYCLVDKTKGVWKAPANVALREVKDVDYIISENEQTGLNVDAATGKSINAIRKFTGKGILIWGSRTLAGNDNEWRYIPVRRFFMMVEESIKKSIQPFVFEPNNTITWTRVKAMVENYLTSKWRDGALAGAKPKDAFFIKVGLGETMTEQDMLDKKMIIEIGMAPVRPAEFIILRIVLKMT